MTHLIANQELLCGLSHSVLTEPNDFKLFCITLFCPDSILSISYFDHMLFCPCALLSSAVVSAAILFQAVLSCDLKRNIFCPLAIFKKTSKAAENDFAFITTHSLKG